MFALCHKRTSKSSARTKKKTRDIARTLFNVKVSNNNSCQIKYERRKNQVLRKTLISSRKRVQQGSLSKIR